MPTEECSVCGGPAYVHHHDEEFHFLHYKRDKYGIDEDYDEDYSEELPVICYPCVVRLQKEHDEKSKWSVAPAVADKYESDVAVKAVSKSISNLAFTRTDHAIVRNALLTLPEHQRNMIILKFWQNMDVDEIAGELKVTVKKVEEELHSGYKTLKERVLKETAFSRTKEQNEARAKEKERLEYEEFLRRKNETKTNKSAA